MKLASRTAAVVLLSLLAACAGSSAPAPDARGNMAKLRVDPALLGPPTPKILPAAAPSPVVAPDPGTAAGVAVAVPVAPADRPAAIEERPPAVEAVNRPIAAQPVAPAPLPPAVSRAKPAAPPIAGDTPRVTGNRSPAVVNPEPALDIATLKARLRETAAIGLMTKLALRNQVDDLLARFRAHHESGRKSGIADLRQPFNALVSKVLSLIQDGDPALARSLTVSREAIWGILADAERFKAET